MVHQPVVDPGRGRDLLDGHVVRAPFGEEPRGRVDQRLTDLVGTVRPRARGRRRAHCIAAIGRRAGYLPCRLPMWFAMASWNASTYASLRIV